jgi:PAS domain S-box-containing protein
VSIATDITLRRANELELQRHRSHLEEMVQEQTASLQRSMTLTQRALSDLRQQKFVLDQHAIVTVTDRGGRITYCNPKFSQISGFSADELLGRDHTIVNSGHHPKGFFKAMYETVQRGEVWHAEVCNRAKDGHLYWVDTTVVAFMGEDGKPREYIAVRTDITERRRVEDAAHAANHAKSEFLANMSHEIRTPMNGVVGMVDILLETELQPAQQRMLDTIHNSSLALLGILNDILDFSKIEAGKLAMEALPTHLREMAEGVVQLLFASAATKGIDLNVFVSPDLAPWAVCDPTRLRQILLNLLGNAIKFSAERPGRVRLSALPCTLTDGRAGVCWRIKDNGIGIGPSALAQLFQPFTQADEGTARKYGGTGLGLSITQRLVVLMGGQISVHSTLGEGSEFTVELPMQVAQPGRIMALDPDLTGMQVVAVTRDADTAQIVSAYCTAAGAQVSIVADLEAARQGLSPLAGTSARCVVLLGLDLSEPESDVSFPPAIGVVRFSACRNGPLASGHEITVSARPLLSRDLLQAVALAGGRFLAQGTAYPGEQRRSPRRSLAPSVEQALADRQLILLAEDNETNREVLQEQLRLLGYAAEVAEDGAIALTMWRRGRYAMLLTDCHMPHMDGFELTEAIRRSEAPGQRLPIVAITANAMQGEAQRCWERGMDDYMAKPLRLSELGAMLTKWLPLPDQVGAATPFDEPEAATEQQAVWDDTTLAKLVGENPGLHRRLLEKFLLHAQAQVTAIDDSYVAGECGKVADVAHTLKSAARTVGALFLGDVCQALESAGRGGELTSCTSLVLNVASAFSAAEQLIRRHLDGDPAPHDTSPIDADPISV